MANSDGDPHTVPSCGKNPRCISSLPGTDYSENYSIEKQEVKSIIPKMGYDLETSGCVLSASNFIEGMNACIEWDKGR
ncbi:MAG: hypothetical protein VB075_16605 [Petrimonas sp.]|uniref:hypothetical protein n=1 Tax=Petrimonas sp. TaxID=2023866 RepID=UPI002B3E52DB|nr:hypothetical protein [Petrimonas sp.]MEA5046175.1 hypothetical protein [Petrimonas sp.]